MNPKSKVTLAAVVALGLLAASFPATADDVPDGLSVEWQGKKPCENLFEDPQDRASLLELVPRAKELTLNQNRAGKGSTAAFPQTKTGISLSEKPRQ
jgi:hypothetical protein